MVLSLFVSRYSVIAHPELSVASVNWGRVPGCAGDETRVRGAAGRQLTVADGFQLDGTAERGRDAALEPRRVTAVASPVQHYSAARPSARFPLACSLSLYGGYLTDCSFSVEFHFSIFEVPFITVPHFLFCDNSSVRLLLGFATQHHCSELPAVAL